MLSSCKTEEDKYPDMKVFSPNMSEDFIFEEINPIPRYYRDTDEYVFFLARYQKDDKLLIYNKKSKKLIKSLDFKSDFIHITTNNSIYCFNEEANKAFKYTAPDFKRKYMEQKSLDYVSSRNLNEKYRSEIQNKGLKEKALYDFLDVKRNEILKKDIIDSLVCIISLSKSNTIIANYKNKEIYLEESDYLYKGTFIKKKLKGVEDCNNSSNFNLDETSYFSKSSINLIDSVTLDYNFSGSNHYVIGVNSKNLYYYELILNDKKLKFKFPHPIKNILNLEGLTVFETVNKYYKVSIKE